MYIQQIISYGNMWNTLVENFPNELEDIKSSITALTPENIGSYSLQHCWATEIQTHGWNGANTNSRGIVGTLGYVKNHVSVVLHLHHDIVTRWLYTTTPIATRNGSVKIPISISLMRSSQETLIKPQSFGFSVRGSTKEELLALSPASHVNPFLLIGIAQDEQGLEITELKSENSGISRHVVINRSIEFAPEYHQAGLGILSYFGTVLREKYPGQNSKVRIEQEGLCVRLVIESDNGDREVIEKALQEYELVVRGETQPDEFFASKTKVLELKNELRIAQVRIESQKDLIAYQGQEVASLRQLIGHSLTSTKSQPISINVNPVITVNTLTTVYLQQNVPLISEYLQELANLAIYDPDVKLQLLDLENSLAALSTEQTSVAVKESNGMKKLKKWLDDAAATGTTANAFLQKVNDGLDLAQKIARHYNKLADWCGAPQVPSLLLGREP